MKQWKPFAFAVVVLGAVLFVAWGQEQNGKPLGDRPYQGWAQKESRGGTRLIYFHKTSPRPWDSSPGQVAIEYGQPVWKPEYGATLSQKGGRWRLGQNQWTNLDTSFDLEIGPETIEVGYYYMALERTTAGDWQLLFFEPEEMRANEMDAWHLNLRDAAEVFSAPLTHEKVEESADPLEIEFKLDPDDDRHASLHIRFGPHRLTADVRVVFPQS